MPSRSSHEIRASIEETRRELSYSVGDLQSKLRQVTDWRSKLAPSGHVCTVTNAEQRPWKGGLRFVSGHCSIALREVGDYLWLTADGCTEQCGSQAYLEPMVIDRRGYCRVLRAETK